jgi:hypothetical protein
MTWEERYPGPPIRRQLPGGQSGDVAYLWTFAAPCRVCKTCTNWRIGGHGELVLCGPLCWRVWLAALRQYEREFGRWSEKVWPAMKARFS